MKYDIVVISGYFNPLHVGHLDYIEAAKIQGDVLIVIVNNDYQVKLKGSVVFMDEVERLRLVRAIDAVNAAVLSVDVGRSVRKSLKTIAEFHKGKKILFATGADHTPSNTVDEAFVCRDLGIHIAYGVGGDKVQSSSKLLENARG